MRFDQIALLNPSITIKKGALIPFLDMAALPVHGRDVRIVNEKPFTGSGARFQKGDTLIARITPCLENGKGAQIRHLPEEAAGFGSTEFIVARGKDDRDTDFIYYLTRHDDFRAEAIKRMEGTSGRQRVAWQQIASIEVPDISSEDRREIAATLGALDDKIELNRETAATLEEMARALYRSWFVAFDPVWAKAEGRTPAHMDNATVALFPNSFGDDGLPVGWQNKTIGNFFTFQRGLSYKGKHLTAHGMPMINLGCFSGNGGFTCDKVKNYSGDYKLRHLVCSGDLVFANTDMTQNRVILGSPHIVEGGNFLYTHHVSAARPIGEESKKWNRFFYFHFLQPEFRERAEGFATGTTVLFLPADAAEAQKVVIPPEAILNVFTRSTQSLLQRKSSLEQESQILATLRNTLLPKLMSGELRVGEAQELISRVA